jgi:hypothetical protein
LASPPGDRGRRTMKKSVERERRHSSFCLFLLLFFSALFL